MEFNFSPANREMEVEVWNYRDNRLGVSLHMDGIPEPVEYGWRYRYVFAGLGLRFP